jgi:hypothetical protein
MKKQYIIFFIIILLVCIVIVSAFIFKGKSKQIPSISMTPTPIITNATPTPTPAFPLILTNVPSQKIQFTNIQPADTSTNIPVSTTITAIFNQDITSQNITFSILPNTPFTLQKNGNTAVVTFQQPLQQTSQYVYSFNLNNTQLLPTFSFTTEGQGQVKLPNTSNNPAGKALEYQKTNDPSLYLQNNTPYETSAFSVDYNFEGSNIYFTVTSKEANKADAKQQFLAWIQSIGLTQQQLQTLDIRYQ